MERALIIGESGGIGRAVAAELRARGVEVTGLSRSHNGLEMTQEASIAAHLGALEGTFDLILVAIGALEVHEATPEKSMRELTPEAMVDQFLLNTVGPAMVLKHGARLLPKDRPSVIAVLSARVGSIGDNRLGGWYSYRVAKAAVNQVVRSASIELARTHKQAACIALHPGTVATEFTRKYVGRHPAVPPEEAAKNLLSVIEGLGPDQTGQFFDWAGKRVEW
ncbi:SDR family NAD(P)-dependent oxidoreductase [Actibacterium pelagium]|uniref:SDR family oxidoreductase n=1 Tax=Actibacterium pelagium TaxID=2029103 RepID=A0A917EKB0_9RHOB|nr:SDR family NAD(P)-dependent oxidoreductase [Actibacterium pelagium]GGE48154.1 SDR family oxidoreductase [Actibacterium pelagium]